MTPVPKYEIELWVNGFLVGDISKLAKNRGYTLTRNAPEELSFSMSLTAFQDYCTEMGADPSVILKPYVTDIRVKRNGAYLFGTHTVDLNFNLTEGEIALEVRATGFLDLFKDRYITKTYEQEDRAEIARDMIATTQVGDLNDWGVVNGPQQYDTGVLSDREYVDQNIKDALINLVNLSDGQFDFKFNYDRSFETFAQLGSDRPNNKLTYPYNITSMSLPRTATNLYNYIIGLGSGFGEETLRNETADDVSRANYGTRQKIISFNSVVQQQILDENTYGFLQQVKDLLELPKLRVPGEFVDLSIIGPGDRIPVEVLGQTMLPLSDTYRIEQIQVQLDDNDAEDINLVVDNF